MKFQHRISDILLRELAEPDPISGPEYQLNPALDPGLDLKAFLENLQKHKANSPGERPDVADPKQIREMDKSVEIFEVIALHKQAFVDYYEGDNHDKEFIQSNDVGNEFKNRCLVHQVEGRIAGYVLFRHEDDHTFVIFLGTNPDFRGRQIASQLLARVQEKSVQMTDSPELRLVAYFRAPGLVRFYIKRGFAKTIGDEQIMMSSRRMGAHRLVPMTCKGDIQV